MTGGEGGKGNHLARGVANVELLQVPGQHAVGSVGLDVDPLDAAALDEVVDVRAAEGGRDRVVDRGDGQAQGAGLVPIHVDAILGHVFQAVGPDLGQDRVLGRHAEELVAGRHQAGVAQAAAVQQLEIEALGLPSSMTAGGAKAKTMALRIWENAPMALPATAVDLQLGPVCEAPSP